MDYLFEIGIQRWVLRDEASPLKVTTKSALIESVESTGNIKSASQDRCDEETSERVQEPDSKNKSLLTSPLTTESEPDSWSALKHDLIAANECQSCAGTHPILGQGARDADWVWVFDAPNGRDIDSQNLMSGRDGQLLDAILRAINMSRENIYLTTAFKCPSSEDYTIHLACGDFLYRQLALIAPTKVIALGEVAAQAVSRDDSSLAQLRKRNTDRVDGFQMVISTYGINELLLKPELKSAVWDDLTTMLSVEN